MNGKNTLELNFYKYNFKFQWGSDFINYPKKYKRGYTKEIGNYWVSRSIVYKYFRLLLMTNRGKVDGN